MVPDAIEPAEGEVVLPVLELLPPVDEDELLLEPVPRLPPVVPLAEGALPMLPALLPLVEG